MILLQKKVQWEFGNIIHIFFAKKAYLNALYVEKDFWESVLSNVAVQSNNKHTRMVILTGNQIRYKEILEKILNLQEEIGVTIRTLPAIQAEMDFLRAAD